MLQILIKCNSICTTNRLYIKRCVELRLGFVISVGEMRGLRRKDFVHVPKTLLNPPFTVSVSRSLPRKSKLIFALSAFACQSAISVSPREHELKFPLVDLLSPGC